ncbi:MAG: hypothetical protein H0V70_11970 [Ktedonobacteraceae bacterium]|nr:hypothetical protein [Ktedonobacteraceae bacterium]
MNGFPTLILFCHYDEFATVGHLYRGIEHGFQHLVEKQGEQHLFIGPPQAQATQLI